uniref:SCP2 domain-containing protein n=1 Tax=Glycine max TaxID=3847 RepID=I1M8M2_SOYBN
MADSSSNLKSDAIMEQMKQHLATDSGKQVTKKIGLVYQIQIAPKKLGIDEVVYTVDLRKGEVTKGCCLGSQRLFNNFCNFATLMFSTILFP